MNQVELCVMCGREIPEGRQVCKICEDRVMSDGRLKFTIYSEPRSKKNSQQIAINRATGRPFVTQSAAYKEFCRECIKQMRMNGFIPKKPIDYPVNIQYLFYKSTRRLCDGLNLSAAMDDILTEARVIDDDHRDIVAGHDGTRVYYDKGEPRVEVIITPMNDYDRWKNG